MPERIIRMQRSAAEPALRPVVLAIAGDSSSGKTTLARGLVEALGPDRCTSICVDDYHRHTRAERAELPFTPLHPDANHLDIMEQHLQLTALGRPVLKPVYDHRTGTLERPEYVESREFVIVEGLLPVATRLARACFDVIVYLEPDEDLRRTWKVARDTRERGYSEVEVIAEMERRKGEAAEFVHPQRRHADIVIRVALEPSDGLGARVRPTDHAALARATSTDILMRPTLRHPDLFSVVTDDPRSPAHLTIIRDDGTPTDLLHVSGGTTREEGSRIEAAMWSGTGLPSPVPDCLGRLADGSVAVPLAITQLLLLHHLLGTDAAAR